MSVQGPCELACGHWSVQDFQTFAFSLSWSRFLPSWVFLAPSWCYISPADLGDGRTHSPGHVSVTEQLWGLLVWPYLGFLPGMLQHKRSKSRPHKDLMHPLLIYPAISTLCNFTIITHCCRRMYRCCIYWVDSSSLTNIIVDPQTQSSVYAVYNIA